MRDSPSLVGRKFGSLSPLYQVAKIGKGARWLCKCDCGAVKAVEAKNLKAKVNPIKSCGCARGYEDLTGRKFGWLSVLSRIGSDQNRNSMWECECRCGKRKIATASDLRNKLVKSCGCAIGEMHGESFPPTAEYTTWGSMIARCHNPSCATFKDYGGRGITVCDEWRESYSAFLDHVGRKPFPRYSIGRIDNDKGYEPGNVRWETGIEQANNKRSNNSLTAHGKTMTCAQWARELGIPACRIYSRIKMGLSPEECLQLGRKKQSPSFKS